MDKIYIGRRYEEGNVVVVAEKDDPSSSQRLEHHVQHSPDGFNWGYSGSDPSELARCILWDFLGEEPTAAAYRDFTRVFIVGIQEDSWTIDSTLITTWLSNQPEEALA